MTVINPKRVIRPTHGDRNNYPRVLDRHDDILRGNVSLGGIDSSGNSVKGHIDNTHVFVNQVVGAGVEFAVTHNLGRIPIGLLIVKQGFDFKLLDSGTAWTDTQMFLKSTQANPVAVVQIY